MKILKFLMKVVGWILFLPSLLLLVISTVFLFLSTYIYDICVFMIGGEAFEDEYDIYLSGPLKGFRKL